MLLDTYFYHLSGAIPAHECQEIIDYGNSLNPKESETAASKDMLSDNEKKAHNEKIRNSKTEWIKDSWLMREITPFVKYANKSWGFDITKYENIQFTKYQPKGHYNWHNDAIKNAMDLKGMNRKLSMSVQLSKPEDYEGGDLRFNLRGLDSHSEDTIMSPPPEFKQQGSIVVFPSFLWHKVEPITKGTRYSLVVWALGGNWK